MSRDSREEVYLAGKEIAERILDLAESVRVGDTPTAYEIGAALEEIRSTVEDFEYWLEDVRAEMDEEEEDF